MGLIQTYQHAWQHQLWLNLLSVTDGLRGAEVVSLPAYMQRSEPICHTSGKHMLWETAAPLSLSVLLGGKPQWNSQFWPLEGVYMCLCVIGMETRILARDSQQWIFFLATHNYTRTHKHAD